MADLQQSINEAHVTILDGASAIGTLTGRPGDNVRPWADVADQAMPVLLYQPLSLIQVRGGIPAQWDAQMQIDAFASGNGAAKKVNDLIEAALTALTHNAFKALGLDAVLWTVPVRQAWAPQDQKSKSSSRLTARATVTITYRVFA
jgi:hypothetical protein